MGVTSLLLAVMVTLSSANVLVYHQHQDNDRHYLRSDTTRPVFKKTNSEAPDPLSFEPEPEPDKSDNVLPKPNSDTLKSVFSEPNSDTTESPWGETDSATQDHVFSKPYSDTTESPWGETDSATQYHAFTENQSEPDLSYSTSNLAFRGPNPDTPDHVSSNPNPHTTDPASSDLDPGSYTSDPVFPEPNPHVLDPVLPDPELDSYTPDAVFPDPDPDSYTPDTGFPDSDPDSYTPDAVFPDPDPDSYTPDAVFPDPDPDSYTPDPVFPGQYPETQVKLLHLIQGTKLQDDRVSMAQEIYGGTFQNCRVHNRVANCSKLGITDITNISLPVDITILDLSNNKIHDIPNHSLAKFSELSQLDLSGNSLQRLNESSFFNLAKLKYLKLNNNRLCYLNGTFPANVFKPLVSLTKLRINSNTHYYNKSSEYPDVALSKLTKLISIYMDAFPKKFGYGFSQMTSLRYLTFDGNTGFCKLFNLSGDIFTYLSQVEHLSMKKCSIHGENFDHDVLMPFKKLHSLDVSRNVELHPGPLGQALQKLRNPKLFTNLNMGIIINPFSPGACVTTKFSKSLPRHLKTITAYSNSLESVENDVFENLPPNLTRLDLTNNRFVFGAYLQNFHKMQNLRVLVLDGGKHSYSLPTYYPNSSTPTTSCSTSIPTQNHLHVSSQKLVLSLPPQLTEVRIKNAGWFQSLTEFHFNETNSLTSLDLKGNNFPRLIGPITGLKALKYLFFENCNIYILNPSFFDDFPSLEQLHLNNNNLGRFSLTHRSPPLFRHLTKLKKLVLDHTSIQNPGFDIFQNLNNIEWLELQDNSLGQFNVNISHMTNLTFLNLSTCDLTTLSDEMTSTLDRLHEKNGNLTIDLSINPIHCSCGNLHFIEWLMKSPVMPKDIFAYACVDDDGTIRFVEKFDNTYAVLQRECHSNRILFITIISVTCLIFSVILCTIIYRFRWSLTYLYYSAYIYITRNEDTQDAQSFSYDVYTSYADEDEDFVLLTISEAMTRKGIKMHIRSRDFRVGEQISSNIVDAVKNSKNTLVVLTPNLLKRKWAKFEIQMTNVERVHTGHPALIFLIKDTVLTSDIGTEMLYLIKSNTHFPYPNTAQCLDQDFMNRYWSQMAHEFRCRRDQDAIPESLVETIQVNSRRYLSNI